MKRIAILPALLIFFVNSPLVAGTVHVWLPTSGTGAWSTGTNWDLGTAPGDGVAYSDEAFLHRTAAVPDTGTKTFSVTLSPADLSALSVAAMNLDRLEIGSRTTNVGDHNNSRTTLTVTGASVASRLALNVGDPSVAYNTTQGLLRIVSDDSGFTSLLNLTNVALTISGINTGRAVRMNTAGGISAVDSIISSISSSTGGDWVIDADSRGAEIDLTGQAVGASPATSSFTISNSINSTTLTFANANPSTPRISTWTNTKLDLDNVTVTAGVFGNVQLFIDNSGISGAGNKSVISGKLINVNQIAGGEFDIAVLQTTGARTTALTGGTINITDDIDLSNVNGAQTGTVQIAGAAVTVADDVMIGYPNGLDTKSSTAVTLASGSSLAITDRMVIGRAVAFGNPVRGAGTFQMTGGTMSVGNVLVGNRLGANEGGSGYYDQTGGNATIAGTMTLLRRNAASGNDYGARELTVGSGATLTFTGPGMAIGTGSDLGLLTTVNLSGTIVFNPLTSTTPTLLAFDTDQGAFLGGNDDIIAFFTTNGIGTLDLTSLDGSEVLSVLPSGIVPNGALYVNALLGLDASEVLTHFDSPLNVYYNPGFSPLLLGQTFALNLGGTLQPLQLPIPEPGTGGLVGCLLLMGVIRRRHACKH